MIREGCRLPLTKVTQAAMKLEYKTSLPRHCKMPSQYFEVNAQPDYYSNVEDFYCQIYFKTVDNLANCILECFNQKYYSMYANYEQFF